MTVSRHYTVDLSGQFLSKTDPVMLVVIKKDHGLVVGICSQTVLRFGQGRPQQNASFPIRIAYDQAPAAKYAVIGLSRYPWLYERETHKKT